MWLIVWARGQVEAARLRRSRRGPSPVLPPEPSPEVPTEAAGPAAAAPEPPPPAVNATAAAAPEGARADAAP
jgi:hypothetical protein